MLVPHGVQVIEIDLKFRAKVFEELDGVVAIHPQISIQTCARRKLFLFHSEVTSREAPNPIFEHVRLLFDYHHKQRSLAPSPVK